MFVCVCVCMCVCVCVCVLTPLHEHDVTQDQFLAEILTGVNSEFYFETGFLTKNKETCLSYFLPIVGEGIAGCMQIALFRVRTRDAAPRFTLACSGSI